MRFTRMSNKPFSKTSGSRLFQLLTIVSASAFIASCSSLPGQKGGESAGGDHKADFEALARTVTNQILDRNPDTIRQSVDALQNGNELLPALVIKLRQQHALPTAPDQLDRQVDLMQKSKMSSKVQISEVASEPFGPKGAYKVDVKGIAELHSDKGDKTHPFHLVYLVSMVNGKPTVDDFQESR